MTAMPGLPRVLVVDDEPGIVSAIKAYLDQEEYAVSVAADGDTAVLAARAFKPDPVILNVMLPGKDDFQV